MLPGSTVIEKALKGGKTVEKNEVKHFSPDEQLVPDISYAASNWRHCEAERKLLVAVLEDAILDYKKDVGFGGVRFREAERWIFGKDTDRLFAFETICSALGLSAQRIRADLVTFAAGQLCAGYGPTDRRRTT
jgi:hypothetical protein